MLSKRILTTAKKVLSLLLNASLLAAMLWGVMPVSKVAAATTGYVQEMDAGGYHTCVVTSDGGVKCWGANGEGQLGNNSQVDSPTPVDVCADAACTSTLTNVKAVVTGFYHTCALTSSNTVKCWGRNDSGQLGNNSFSLSLTPVDVCADASCLTDLSNVKAITAGDLFTCAAMNDGYVKCWGENGDGQLGVNHQFDRGYPVDVCATAGCPSLLADIESVAAGEFSHLCCHERWWGEVLGQRWRWTTG